jgi:7-cyano-7-deazaguanine synthase in queuosine biosynthesis
MVTSFQINKPSAAPFKTEVHPWRNAILFSSAVIFLPTVTTAIVTGDHNAESASVIFNKTSAEARKALNRSLDLIAQLQSNWDGYDAPAISRQSLDRGKKIISLLSDNVVLDIKVSPTEYGATHLSYANPAKQLKAEIDLGDDAMSFYILRGSQPADCHSFLPYSDENIHLLTSLLEA